MKFTFLRRKHGRFAL